MKPSSSHNGHENFIESVSYLEEHPNRNTDFKFESNERNSRNTRQRSAQDIRIRNVATQALSSRTTNTNANDVNTLKEQPRTPVNAIFRLQNKVSPVDSTLNEPITTHSNLRNQSKATNSRKYNPNSYSREESYGSSHLDDHDDSFDNEVLQQYPPSHESNPVPMRISGQLSISPKKTYLQSSKSSHKNEPQSSTSKRPSAYDDLQNYTSSYTNYEHRNDLDMQDYSPSYNNNQVHEHEIDSNERDYYSNYNDHEDGNNESFTSTVNENSVDGESSIDDENENYVVMKKSKVRDTSLQQNFAQMRAQFKNARRVRKRPIKRKVKVAENSLNDHENQDRKSRGWIPPVAVYDPSTPPRAKEYIRETRSKWLKLPEQQNRRIEEKRWSERRRFLDRGKQYDRQRREHLGLCSIPNW
jgi:hypothetical protein